MKKHRVVFLILMLAIAAGPAWAQVCGHSNFDVSVEDIIKNLDCLNEKAFTLDMGNGSLESKINDLQEKLERTELELRTALTRIETLEKKENDRTTREMFAPPLAPHAVSRPKSAAEKVKPPAKAKSSEPDQPKE